MTNVHDWDNFKWIREALERDYNHTIWFRRDERDFLVYYNATLVYVEYIGHLGEGCTPSYETYLEIKRVVDKVGKVTCACKGEVIISRDSGKTCNGCGKQIPKGLYRIDDSALDKEEE